MNDDVIADLMKFSSPFEIYIVNKNNRIVCLKCPFKVEVKYNIGQLKEQEIVFVDKVKITYQLISVFIVRNQAYYFYHFIIL